MTSRTLIDTPLDVLFSDEASVVQSYIDKLKRKTQNKDVKDEIERMVRLKKSITLPDLD